MNLQLVDTAAQRHIVASCASAWNRGWLVIDAAMTS
jgi:hypothetical protein